LGYVPVIGEQISSFGKFADAAKSFSTELALCGRSLRHPPRSPMRTWTKPLSRYWRVLRVIRSDRSAVIL
jgi:hypothetical protein